MTIANIAPGGVTRAAEYIRTVSYTVYGSAGTAFAVSVCPATCKVPTTTCYSDGSSSGDVTIANLAPGEVTCAGGSSGTGSHLVCGSVGTAYPTSACHAPCTVPTTTGYSVGSGSGNVTIANFAPGAVRCAAGYTGTVCCAVCRFAGPAYSVSACQATGTVPTTTGYSTGSGFAGPVHWSRGCSGRLRLRGSHLQRSC